MKQPETISDEIIIVGSRYGDFADVLKPYYEKGEPIEPEDIGNVLGSDEVLLSVISNNHDPYAVGVYTLEQRSLGFVWMYQSPSVYQWLEDHDREFVRAHVKRIISKGGLMVAEPDQPMKLVQHSRTCWGMDPDWAINIPARLHSITEQSIGLGMALLMDDLETATQWSDHLQMRINNLLRDLPLDLSAHNCQKGLKLFEMMRDSEIAEVRQRCDEVLASFVSRGSMAQMTWWVEHWMPNFFRDIANDVLSIFEAANYTLDRVEELLDRAPDNLFYLYKADRLRFAFHLYYLALPQPLYTRLLTLLAVREAMLNKQGGGTYRASDLKLTTPELMVNVVEQTMNEGLWYGATGWAVVYRVYQKAGYKGSYSEFVREAIDWPWTRKIDYIPTEDAVSKPLRDGKMMADIKDWATEGVAKRNRRLAESLMKKMGIEIDLIVP